MPRDEITTSYTTRTKPSTSYTVEASVSTPDYSTPRKEPRGLLEDAAGIILTDHNGIELTTNDIFPVNKISTNYT